MPQTNNTCLQYWVRLDQNHYPVAGSQQGFPLDNPPCQQVCQWAHLKTTPYTAPVGTHVCLQPDGLRYFYGIDRKGQIVPNSLKIQRKIPKTPGVCNYYIEYLKFCQ